MQQNDLEKFIQDNRDGFDDAYPSLKLWADIERQLDGTPPVRQLRTIRPWYQVAAAVVILLSVGGLGGAYWNQQQSAQPLAQEMLDEIAPEFTEMEQYYNQQISEKYAQLTAHTQDQDLDADLAQMDKTMLELRAELSQAPPGREQQVVQQLIETYRLKLQILERILERIEQTNPDNNTPDNKQNNETSI